VEVVYVVIGIMIGFAVSSIIRRKHPVGFLRIDKSDPDGPYLFLELKKSVNEITYFRVSVPAAKSGIAAAVVLGVGRSIGEAMAVMMVSGNATSRMPSLFESVRFLTTAVASEMSYSSGLQQQALFSIALVLFLFIMLINAGLNLLLKRNKEG